MIFLLLLFSSCNEEWLEAKRDISLAIPTTLQDMRALLNNTNVFQYENRGFADPLADGYYITEEEFQSLDELNRNLYTWKKDHVYAGRTSISDWDDSYEQVFFANVVLEGLSDITPGPGQQEEWNDVKGGALLFRARAFYNLAQLFCASYDPSTARTDMGIPLRLVSDVEAPVVRSTVQETYAQIIEDLKEAAGLLRVTPEFKSDASRPAAFGLLARCFLSMRDYDQALSYADSCLRLYDVLLDYNELNSSTTYPFERFNGEVILHGRLAPTYPLTSVSRGIVDSLLLASYDENDLRGSLFFRINADGGKTFRGAYTGLSSRFSGIATDEMLLTRAECYARSGETGLAMTDLNTLLEKRFREGTFVPLVANDGEDPLSLILAERRKELLFRGLRWSDLRRLNKEPGFAITLQRKAGGQLYSLPPGDPRYILPIPDYVIEYSGIAQNER